MPVVLAHAICMDCGHQLASAPIRDPLPRQRETGWEFLMAVTTEHQSRCTGPIKAPSPAAAPPTVHRVHGGYAACRVEQPRFGSLPGYWPPGHLWSMHWAEVTCTVCLRHAPAAQGYVHASGEEIGSVMDQSSKDGNR